MICKLRKLVLLALSVVVCGWASTVVEDSRSRFVLDDVVYDNSAHSCDDGASARFVPDESTPLDGINDAYRVYHVALPSNAKPSVSVGKVKLVSLGKPLCKGDSLKFHPLSVSKPYMRDGLWISEIVVPLFEKKGSSVALRKSFELVVEFAELAASGSYPGKRAVGRVVNKKAAARFGVDLGKNRKALRRAAQSDLENIEFLANIYVGDKNVASFSEDGLIAVDYKTISNAIKLLSPNDSALHGIPIDKLCLYGANPDTLSDMVPGSSLWTPNQIFEIPLEIRDHSASSEVPDRVFGPGDSIVFVGYGTSIWKRADREDPSYENGSMDYFHSYSPYSYYQSFAFGYKSLGQGLRFTTLPSPAASGKSIKLMRYIRAEKEQILRDSYFGKDLQWDEETGKEWFWFWHCRYDTTRKDNSELSSGFPQITNLRGFVDGGKNYVAVSYIPHRSVWKTSAEIEGDQKANIEMSRLSLAERMAQINFNFDVNGETFNTRTLMPGANFRLDGVHLKASNNVYTLTMLPNSIQYDRFDGFTVAYEWKPQVDTADWILPGAVSGVVQLPVGTDSKLRLMKFKDYEPQGLLKIDGGIAKDSIAEGEDVRYMLYREGVYRSASRVEAIPEHMDGALRDLSKINNKTEYLIISPDELKKGAYELARLRTSDSAVATFPTTLVLAEDIYRLYTGGAPSPVAIRNYLAYARSICPNLKYVLLVGYGHYDYRSMKPNLPKNYLPVFEKDESISEDFFGILDSGEVSLYGDYDVDLAIGRLTVTSQDELDNYLEKARNYEQVHVYDHSEWRSTLILAADDAQNGNDLDMTKHTFIQEDLARLIDSTSRQMNIKWNQKKIYLLNFREDGSGQKKDAAQQMVDAINQGALMTSYFGHASVTDWASEGLLKTSYIPRLTQSKLYTILNSFSCVTSRFDNGSTNSLTHKFVVSPKVGAIASVGASRETFADFNERFALKYIKSALFDSATTLGDAFLVGKRMSTITFDRTRYNNEHYVLFGEPVLMMPYSVGNINFDNPMDTLKALDKVRLSGSVSKMNDGMVYLMLREGRYDKKMYIGFHDDAHDFKYIIDEKTKDTIDKVDAYVADYDTINVPFEGALIYSEKIKVEGGRFDVEFVTPRKMAFGDTAVELQAWAYSNDEKPIARNWKGNIAIAGISTYADSIHDEEPPSIKIHPCVKSGLTSPFSEGQTVKLQAPACLQVVIDDSTAIDYREQADEGVSFEIENWQTPFHPYPYQEQSSRHAVVRMNFSEESYPEGKYVFKVRAFDVLGNMSEKKVNLEITDDMDAGLEDVFNVPNPMGKKGTTFYFKNYADAANRDFSVNIFIYNQNGKLVKVIKNAVSGVTHWDGRDNHGNLLANGLYHYVVQSKVKATEDFGKKTWTKKQKLVISR